MKSGKRQVDQKFIGTRLRKWRKSNGLKVYELAKNIGVSQPSLSDIENNKSLPSAETLIKLYKTTDISIIWLLMEEGPMNREEDLSVGSTHKIIDKNLQDLTKLLVRVYNAGNKEKLAHLTGFLHGVVTI